MISMGKVSAENSVAARHFMTAKQYAQESTRKNGDARKIASAIREMSDGLMWLALDIAFIRQETLARKKN